LIRGILRAEEDAGPARSGEDREMEGILPAEDSERDKESDKEIW
jgi:hypothetical protein